MNNIKINKFLNYTYFSPKILFEIMIESEKIRKNPNYLIETEKNYELDIIKYSFPKSLYFYNGPNHLKSCIYSYNQYNDELIPYLVKKLQKHKDLKRFNDISLKDYINTKWKKLKKFVYINLITTIVRFDNLNDKECLDTLLDLKKNTQPELCIDNANLLKIKKEYKKI